MDRCFGVAEEGMDRFLGRAPSLAQRGRAGEGAEEGMDREPLVLLIPRGNRVCLRVKVSIV